MTVKVLCVYDEGSMVNTSLIGAKGTSFLVESEGRRILFDTGLRDRYLQHNIEALDVDPNSIEALVVSQTCPDNSRAINGLLDMRESAIDVYAPDGLYSGKRTLFNKVGLTEDNSSKITLHQIDGWKEIIPHVWLTPQMISSFGYSESYLVIDSYHLGIVSGRCQGSPSNILQASKDRFGKNPKYFVGSVFLEKQKKELAYAYADEFESFGCSELHLNHCTGRDGMTNLRVRLGLEGVNEFYVGSEVQI